MCNDDEYVYVLYVPTILQIHDFTNRFYLAILNFILFLIGTSKFILISTFFIIAYYQVESNDRRCACSTIGRHYQSKSNSYLTNGSCHEPNGQPDRTYKVVLAGDAAVGKSCLIHRFCKGSFVKRLGSTLGTYTTRSLTKVYNIAGVVKSTKMRE